MTRLQSRVKQARSDKSTRITDNNLPNGSQVERLDVTGKTVYSIASGALLICLDHALTLETIRAIAALKSERVVCLDEGFAGNDQLKANAVQIFKTQGVTSCKTV